MSEQSPKIQIVRLFWQRFRAKHRAPGEDDRSRKRIFDLERERAMLAPEFEELEQPDPALLMRPVAPPYESMPGKKVFIHRDDGRWFIRRHDEDISGLGMASDLPTVRGDAGVTGPSQGLPEPGRQ